MSYSLQRMFCLFMLAPNWCLTVDDLPGIKKSSGINLALGIISTNGQWHQKTDWEQKSTKYIFDRLSNIEMEHYLHKCCECKKVVWEVNNVWKEIFLGGDYPHSRIVIASPHRHVPSHLEKEIEISVLKIIVCSIYSVYYSIYSII